MQLARAGTTESQVANLGELIPSAIVLDLILIAAPFIVNSQINKRGIDDEVLSKNADVAALAGLLVLAMMDSSGGLLLISMFVLATFRAIKHRHNMLLMASPIIFAFIGTTWVKEIGLANTILEAIGFECRVWILHHCKHQRVDNCNPNGNRLDNGNSRNGG